MASNMEKKSDSATEWINSDQIKKVHGAKAADVTLISNSNTTMLDQSQPVIGDEYAFPNIAYDDLHPIEDSFKIKSALLKRLPSSQVVQDKRIEWRSGDSFHTKELSNAKAFLFIGESGAGKTQMINSMASYLWGVK